MGLYACVDLSEYVDLGNDLVQESENDISDNFDDYMDSQDGGSGKDDGELEWDDYDSSSDINWSNDPRDIGLAFERAFMNTARELCPVRTGYLRSTIHCDVSGDMIECYADADYAQYVEYGTSRMAAQPYFEPALLAGIEAALEAGSPLINEKTERLYEQQLKAIEDVCSSIDGDSIWVIFIIIIILVILMSIAEMWHDIINETMSSFLAQALLDGLTIEIT